MRAEDTPGRDRRRIEKDREQEQIQTRFEVCRLAIIRFYSLVPEHVESQDKELRHYIKIELVHLL